MRRWMGPLVAVGFVVLGLGLVARPPAALAGLAPTGPTTVGRVLADPVVDYPAAVMASGPLAYYRLDEALYPCELPPSSCPLYAGAAIDSAGGASGWYYDSITPPAGVSGAIAGGPGKYFAGGCQDQVVLPNGWSGLNAGLTLEAWIKPRPGGGWGVIGLSNGGLTDLISLGTGVNADGTGNLTFLVRNTLSNSGGLGINWALSQTVWQHVVATQDGTTGTVILYRNGLRVAEGWAPLPTANTRTFNRLAHNMENNCTWNGELDEVAIYTRALPPAEVKAHYQAAGYQLPQAAASPYKDAVMTDSPTAYWRLNEPTGENVAWDLTNNDNNAVAQANVTHAITAGLRSDADPAMNLLGQSGSYLPIPPGFNNLGAGLTLEAWIKPTPGGVILALTNGASADVITLYVTAPDTATQTATLGYQVINGAGLGGGFLGAAGVLRLGSGNMSPSRTPATGRLPSIITAGQWPAARSRSRPPTSVSPTTSVVTGTTWGPSSVGWTRWRSTPARCRHPGSSPTSWRPAITRSRRPSTT